MKMEMVLEQQQATVLDVLENHGWKPWGKALSLECRLMRHPERHEPFFVLSDTLAVYYLESKRRIEFSIPEELEEFIVTGILPTDQQRLGRLLNE